MDEGDLIKASQQGDINAFNQLVLTHQQTVYNLAYRIIGEAEEAEDVTQDVFISAYRGLPKFRGGSFKGWLLRIATNSCYDRIRHHRRHPQTSLEETVIEDGGPVSSETSPDEHALRQELASYIQRGLASLPPEMRVVVVLSDVQDMSYDDIAKITRSSLGTVKSRLSRGRAHLRDYLLQQRELLPTRFRLVP